MSTYYERNREQILQRQKARDANRRSEIADYQKAYRRANRDRLLAYHRDYYDANKEELKARQRDYYQVHKAYYALINQAYYTRNKHSMIEAQREYYDVNRDIILAQKREYYKINKADFLRRNAERRAIEKKATPRWADLQAMSALYQRSIDLTKRLGIIHHVHHIVPLRDDPNVCGLHCESNLQIVTEEEEHWILHRAGQQ